MVKSKRDDNVTFSNCKLECTIGEAKWKEPSRQPSSAASTLHDATIPGCTLVRYFSQTYILISSSTRTTRKVKRMTFEVWLLLNLSRQPAITVLISVTFSRIARFDCISHALKYKIAGINHHTRTRAHVYAYATRRADGRTGNKASSPVICFGINDISVRAHASKLNIETLKRYGR